MTKQETIIPESIGEKIVRGFKRETKSRKLFIAVSLLALCILAGYAFGYTEGYHSALVDFEIIAGRVITL
jgi:hypothetical protein